MAEDERPEPVNLPFALAALLGARTWAEARRVLEDHPELLSDEGLRLFDRGLGAVRGAGPAANPHLPLFEEQRRLLVRCREVGVEAAFAELELRSAGPSQGPGLGRMPEAAGLRLLTAIRELTGAGGLDARRRVLERHPELLTDEAIAVLDGAIEAARSAAGDDFLAMLQAHRRLLIRCRDVGVPAAFAELAADAEPAETMEDLRTLPRDVIGALRELGRLDRERATDDQRRVQLCETVIAGTGRPEHRRLRATMQAVEGRTLLLGNVVGDRSVIVERAIRCFESALTVLDVEDGADWATAQHLLGLAYRQRSEGEPDANADRAIACFEAALLVRSKDATPVPWATTQHELGYALWSRRAGDRALHLERAIACFLASLEVFTADRTPRQWGAAKHNLGNAYLDRVHGDPAEDVERAIVSYEEALRVRTRDADSGDWAATMVGLGAAFQMRVRGERADNLERAIACCRGALEVYAPELDRIEWIRAQRTLAGAYANRVLGEPHRNRELATDALRQALTACGPNSLPEEWAGVQHGLGILLSDGAGRGGSDEAIACFQAALTVWTRDAAPDEWAATQVCLGAAHAEGTPRDREAAMEAAIGCYEAALEVQAGRASVLTRAMTTHNLAAAYAARVAGQPAENLGTAARLYEQALAVLTPERFPVHCRAAGRQLGDVLAELGRWSDAAVAYERALDGAERAYQASLLDAAREAELAETSGLHHHAAIAMIHAGRVLDAVVTLERGRARGLGEVLARDRADLTEIARLDPDAVEAYRRAASAIRALERRGVPALGPPHGPDADVAEAARQAQAELRAAIDRIRLLPEHSDFLAWPSWSDVAAAVTATRPIAYMTATPHGGAVLLVHRAGADGRPAPELVALTGPVEAATLDRLVLTAREGDEPEGYVPAAVAETPAHRQRLDSALDDLLPALGETLVAPLAARLVQINAAGVVLIACGRLGVLPLHAAPIGDVSEARCLLDQLEVTYAPSARLLTEAGAALERLGAPEPVLAGVGNPLPSRPELPFAEAELRVIASLFGDRARPRYGKEATIARLLEDAPDATHVHLSCHGLFDAGEPLGSRLLLAGSAEPEPLLLRDVLRLRPFAGARLIVASACQTALVDFARLPDEVIGLPAALLRGGTPGMVGTLWPVNDLSTALLMCRFYEYHLGHDGYVRSRPMAPAAALRRAQRWLRDATVVDVEDYASARPALARTLAERTAGRLEWARRLGPEDRPFASPRFWAPFVFVGV